MNPETIPTPTETARAMVTIAGETLAGMTVALISAATPKDSNRPSEPPSGRHGWQSFVTYVDPKKAPMPRNKIMERLQSQGIATRPGTHAVHMLNLYRERFGLTPEDFPVARDCSDYSMAIPLHNRMSEDDYRYVVDRLGALAE